MILAFSGRGRPTPIPAMIPGFLTAALGIEHLADGEPGAGGDTPLLIGGTARADDGRGDVRAVAVVVGDVVLTGDEKLALSGICTTRSGCSVSAPLSSIATFTPWPVSPSAQTWFAPIWAVKWPVALACDVEPDRGRRAGREDAGAARRRRR